MDSLEAARALCPHPTLLGLIDDMGRLIAGHYLGLLRTPFPPEAVPTLAALRLLNRETYFFLDALGAPPLTALPSKVSLFIIRFPWYRSLFFIQPVINAHPTLRLAVFATCDFWAALDDASAFPLLETALRRDAMHVLAAGIAMGGLSFDELWRLQRATIEQDHAPAYRLVAPCVDRMAASKDTLKRVLRRGARTIFHMLLEEARQKGTAEVFLRECAWYDCAEPVLAARIEWLRGEPPRARPAAPKRARADAPDSDEEARPRKRPRRGAAPGNE